MLPPLPSLCLLLWLPHVAVSRGVLELNIAVHTPLLESVPELARECCRRSTLPQDTTTATSAATSTTSSTSATPSTATASAPPTGATNCSRAQCLIRLQFCLTIAFVNSAHPLSCVYDRDLSSALSVAAFEARKINFAFHVSSRWQQTFALVIDVIAVTGPNDTNGPRVHRQVVRSSGPVPPSKHWLNFPLLKPFNYSYRFQCDEHFYGIDCTKKCQARNGVHGHYNCSKEGKVVCHPGWSGDFCTVAQCEGGCGTYGQCKEPNRCDCDPGWSGPRCDECQRHPTCQNGTCATRNGYSEPFTCACDSGWGGMFCNIDLNFCTNHPNPCKNGGACLNKRSTDTYQQYTCRCPSGFRGTHCEQTVADCRFFNCSGHGQCREPSPEVKDRAWHCVCEAPFYGENCQFNQTTCADRPCMGAAATCHPDATRGFRCDCPRGFEGRNCELNIDDCSSNPCKNNGKCVDDINGFKCICPVGFYGAYCHIDNNECLKVTCLNKGRCVDMANSVECRCRPGFSGSFCQFEIDECLAQPCQNGANCLDRINDYLCQCRTGFAGKNCHINVTDPCAARPCVNGGVCHSLAPPSGGNVTAVPFLCDCPRGHRGRLCEQLVPNVTVTLPPQPPQLPAPSDFSPLEVALIVSIGISLPLVTMLFGVLLCICRHRGHKKRPGGKESRLSHAAVHDHMVHNQLNSLRHIRNDLGTNGTMGGASGGAGPQPLLAVRKVPNTERLINYKHIPPPPFATVALPVHPAKLAHLEGIDNCSLTGDDGLASSCASSMIEKSKELDKTQLQLPPSPPPSPPPPPPPPPPPNRRRNSPDGADRKSYACSYEQFPDCEREPLRGRAHCDSPRSPNRIYSVDLPGPLHCSQPAFLQDLLSAQGGAALTGAAVDMGQAGLWHDFQVTEV